MILDAYGWHEVRNNALLLSAFPGSTVISTSTSPVIPNGPALGNRGFYFNLTASNPTLYNSVMIPDLNDNSRNALRIMFRLLHQSTRTFGSEVLATIYQKGSSLGTVLAYLMLVYDAGSPGMYGLKLVRSDFTTVIGTTGYVFNNNAYTQFELKLSFVNATNFEMHSSGSTVTLSSLGATAASSLLWGEIQFSGQSIAGVSGFYGLTDVVVWDDVANIAPDTIEWVDFMGDKIVDFMVPIAETALGASYNQWTGRPSSKLQAIDDYASGAESNLDADYIESTAAAQAQTFGFTTPSFISDISEVDALVITAHARSIASVTKQVALAWVVSPVVQTSPLISVAGANWRTIRGRIEFPDSFTTPGPWPTAGEFGAVSG